jgi:glycosyltransferase involved in cell wall biosynthesis
MAQGRAQAGQALAVPRIVAAGDLIPLKAYEVLLRALGQLKGKGEQFELMLAGEGPEKPRLQKLAEEAGIRQRVEFLGSIDDVPTLFSSAHLLVHPSRSEGLSNTILEAMAEGLPVVATNVGGTPEIIIDGKTGFLVPPDRPDLLASKIGRLLRSPCLRAQLGKAGLESVRQRYNTQEVTTQYESIYRSVVSV